LLEIAARNVTQSQTSRSGKPIAVASNHTPNCIFD